MSIPSPTTTWSDAVDPGARILALQDGIATLQARAAAEGRAGESPRPARGPTLTELRLCTPPEGCCTASSSLCLCICQNAHRMVKAKHTFLALQRVSRTSDPALYQHRGPVHELLRCGLSSSAPSGTTVAAAAVGVGARESATKSTMVKSTSCPTPVTTGTCEAATARATAVRR